MNEEELERWFEGNRQVLETAYVAGKQPWQQSGFGLRTPRSAQDWQTLRKPIADCVETSGSFLDIGCANGYLLECVLNWTQARGLTIKPYGLDFSEKMIMLAQQRLPQYATHLFIGNAWHWEPPLTFDYVNTTLDYVPQELHKSFVERVLERYLRPGGRLIVAEYMGRSPSLNRLEAPIAQYLEQLGFCVESSRFANIDAFAKTRLAVIKKSESESKSENAALPKLNRPPEGGPA